MKALQFTIPVAEDNCLMVQEDILPDFYPHFHRHHEMQITWILKGKGTVLTGNSMHRFESDDIFLIGPNQPHVFRSDAEFFSGEGNQNVHAITVFFNPGKLMGHLFMLPEMRMVKEFLTSALNGLQASALQRQIIAEHILTVKRNTSGFRLASFIGLLQMMATIGDWKVLSNDALLDSVIGTEGARMNDIYQYTMKNFTKDISIEKIAAVAYLSPPAFCRYFKKRTSKTYIRFLNEIRINEVCNQILNGDDESFASIAYKSGFNNPVTFNRVFRKSKGISPSQFAKVHAKNAIQ